jgi:hypothetical protein
LLIAHEPTVPGVLSVFDASLAHPVSTLPQRGRYGRVAAECA